MIIPYLRYFTTVRCLFDIVLFYLFLITSRPRDSDRDFWGFWLFVIIFRNFGTNLGISELNPPTSLLQPASEQLYIQFKFAFQTQKEYTTQMLKLSSCLGFSIFTLSLSLLHNNRHTLLQGCLSFEYTNIILCIICFFRCVINICTCSSCIRTFF